MKVIVLGATGMVGAGVLREALAAPDVDAVLSVGRRSCGVQHPKLRERVLPDMAAAAAEAELTGWDACIWAVGISSIGLDEAAYARITEDLTLRGRCSKSSAAARVHSSSSRPTSIASGADL